MNAKTRTIIVGILFIAILIGGGFLLQYTFRSKAALDFNNDIVEQQNSFQQEFLKFAQFIAYTDLTEEEIREKQQQLIKDAKDGRTTIDALDVPDHGEKLHSTALELFDFYAAILETEYNTIITLLYKEGRTNEDFTEITRLVNQTIQAEQTYVGLFNEAQEDFADTYSLRVKEDDSEK